LSEQKETIEKRWLEGILGTYSAQTARFLHEQKDRFANPVGQNLASAVHSLVEELVQGSGHEALAAPLDTIIRIRAVQEFTASQAVAFVFLLKQVVRETLKQPVGEGKLDDAVLAFERRVDELALFAFDIYMGCREKLCEIRVEEMKRRTSKLVERMNRIYGAEGEEPPLESGPSAPDGQRPKEQE